MEIKVILAQKWAQLTALGKTKNEALDELKNYLAGLNALLGTQYLLEKDNDGDIAVNYPTGQDVINIQDLFATKWHSLEAAGLDYADTAVYAETWLRKVNELLGTRLVTDAVSVGCPQLVEVGTDPQQEYEQAAAEYEQALDDGADSEKLKVLKQKFEQSKDKYLNMLKKGGNVGIGFTAKSLHYTAVVGRGTLKFTDKATTAVIMTAAKTACGAIHIAAGIGIKAFDLVDKGSEKLETLKFKIN